MVRRIEVEHILFERLEHRRRPRQPGQLVGRENFPSVLAEAIVLEDGEYIVVARDEPGPLLIR